MFFQMSKMGLLLSVRISSRQHSQDALAVILDCSLSLTLNPTRNSVGTPSKFIQNFTMSPQSLWNAFSFACPQMGAVLR